VSSKSDDSDPILILDALALAHKITSPYEGTYGPKGKREF